MVSVVIPAFNEEKTLGRCLEAFVAQKTSTPFEVLIVCNNSSDKTPEVAESFNTKLNLRVVHQTKKGRSPARRAGFAHAKGDIIFSTDADTIVPENWIEDILPYFNDKKIIAVSGTCKIIDCSPRINTTFNILQPTSMRLYRLFRGHYWLSGFNFAIRRDVYKKSGGFNPELNIQEDTELAIRVSKIGKIKFITRPVVIFSGRRFQKGLIRGLMPYVISYWHFFISNNVEKTHLSDVR